MVYGQSIIDKVLTYFSQLKDAIIETLRGLPFFSGLSDFTLQWVIIGFFFFLAVAIIVPLIKWSVKVSLVAVIVSGIVAIFTSYSFWGILPFTALGTAVLLLFNRG
jgi:hypothetical protein